MPEGIGQTLKKAREAKGIVLEDAARATKIRPARLEDLENEDFSHFPTLVYARGFLNIYARYLGVDVSRQLDEMAGADLSGTDGYAYLTAAESETHEVARRKPPSPLPKIIAGSVVFAAILVLFMAWFLLGWYAERLTPSEESASEQPPAAEESVPPAAATPDPVTTPGSDSLPAPNSRELLEAGPGPPSLAPPIQEPEIRRAIPVLPGELEGEPAAPGPDYEVEIRPVRGTELHVQVGSGSGEPAYNGRFDENNAPLIVRGSVFRITVGEVGAVRIFRNGQEVPVNSNLLILQ